MTPATRDADQPKRQPHEESAAARHVVTEALTSAKPLVTMSREDLVLIALDAGAAAQGAEYVPFADAVERELVEVHELDGGSVPALTAVAKGSDVLLLDGDTVVGGKQNRVVNITIWLAASTTTTIPVTCLEAGRWDRAPGRFDSGRKVDLAMREKLHRMVNENVHRSAEFAPEASPAYVADQSAVWEEIGRKHARAGMRSETAALHDLYAREADELAQIRRAFPYPQGACGLAVAIGGSVMALDLFDAPKTLEHQWPRLVEAAASAWLDERRAVALGTKAKVAHRYPDPGALDRLLDRARGVLGDAEVHPSVGAGYDVRMSGEKVHGSALVHRGRAVHVALFRGEPVSA
ncbi:MAG: hypothetical protein H0X16_11350 [Chloroflexi bacterium]|nr:hypothetical protein [Chloroflexota bacterium]